jgi:hypothetical protein
MTDEQILELAEKHFSFIAEYTASGWIADTEDLLKFAQAIRKETIEEVLTSLKDVPNPEANRTAINRIMSMNYD